MTKPQMKWAVEVGAGNSDEPFMPKLRVKPNARVPLELRLERAEDVAVGLEQDLEERRTVVVLEDRLVVVRDGEVVLGRLQEVRVEPGVLVVVDGGGDDRSELFGKHRPTPRASALSASATVRYHEPAARRAWRAARSARRRSACTCRCSQILSRP